MNHILIYFAYMYEAVESATIDTHQISRDEKTVQEVHGLPKRHGRYAISVL